MYATSVQSGRIARQGQQYAFRVQQERTVSQAGPSQHQPAGRVRQIRIAQQVLNYAISVRQVRRVRRGRAFAPNSIRTNNESLFCAKPRIWLNLFDKS
jgi:hypothetical protein